MSLSKQSSMFYNDLDQSSVGGLDLSPFSHWFKKLPDTISKEQKMAAKSLLATMEEAFIKNMQMQMQQQLEKDSASATPSLLSASSPPSPLSASSQPSPLYTPSPLHAPASPSSSIDDVFNNLSIGAPPSEEQQKENIAPKKKAKFKKASVTKLKPKLKKKKKKTGCGCKAFGAKCNHKNCGCRRDGVLCGPQCNCCDDANGIDCCFNPLNQQELGLSVNQGCNPAVQDSETD